MYYGASGETRRWFLKFMKSEEQKMKKVLSVICAILLASALVVSACAEAVSSPKVEAPKVTEIVIKDAEGNVISTVSDGEDTGAYLKLTSLLESEEEEIPEETKAALEEAYEAAKSVGSIGEILPEYEGKEMLDIMHVSFSQEIADAVAQGGSIGITTDVKLNLEEGTKLPIIRFIDGEWVESPDEYAEVLADGTVVLHLNQDGVFSILVDPDTEVLEEEEAKAE